MAFRPSYYTRPTWHLVEQWPDGRRKVVDVSRSRDYVLSRMVPAARRLALDDPRFQLRVTESQVAVHDGQAVHPAVRVESCDDRGCGSFTLLRQRPRRRF